MNKQEYGEPDVLWSFLITTHFQETIISTEALYQGS